MYLEKWYADRVADGHVQIRYRANLHLGPLTVGYGGGIGTERENAITVGLRGLPMPTVVGNIVRWPGSETEDALVWTGAVLRPVELWRYGDRAVCWSPIVLNGEAKPSEEARTARGYVERLTLNVPPWHLGIQTLRWGRFCGQRHSLVWIEWQGCVAKRLALLNGYDDPLYHLTPTEVVTQHARLRMEAPHEIVCERLGTGALEVLGWIRMIAARRFLAGLETKWFAEASLTADGQEADRGEVVCEEVVWP